MTGDGIGQIPPLSPAQWIPPLMPCAQFQCLCPPWRWREKQKNMDTLNYWPAHSHTFTGTCSDLILHWAGLFCMRSVTVYLLEVMSYSHPQAEVFTCIMVQMDISSGGHWLEWHLKDDSLVSPNHPRHCFSVREESIFQDLEPCYHKQILWSKHSPKQPFIKCCLALNSLFNVLVTTSKKYLCPITPKYFIIKGNDYDYDLHKQRPLPGPCLAV